MSTKLRGNAPRREGPYPLGEIPDQVILEVGKKIVHRLAVGNANIVGDDFGKIFADAVGGNHRGKPLGIADVGLDDCAWSIKTIQESKPFTKSKVRLISGRNSPIFSENIENPFEDIQATGASVLRIWNARVDEALDEYKDLRIALLLRNMNKLEFSLMEFEAHRYQPRDYEWELKSGRNWIGRDHHGKHVFTWQSHGSQFTIHHDVSPSMRKFRILKHPPVLSEASVLTEIKFDPSWIQTF